MKEVNAVIVTFNRLPLLKEAVTKLLEQTVQIKKIVIVDNASTDGTKEYLEDITTTHPSIVVVSLTENLGGAGGFHYGIRKAYEIGCDYLWIMDDDTLATPTALQKLLEFAEFLSSKPNRPLGFLSSNVLYKDGAPCLMNIPGCAPIWNEYIEQGVAQIGNTSFVAMLIPTSVVKEVGLPIKEFFIWGDDGEYSTRIAARYLGFLVGQSQVYHYMNENKGVDIFATPNNRIGRFYYFYRNWMYTNLHRGKKCALRFVVSTLIFCLRILRSHTECKCKKISTILKGLWDGIWLKATIEYVD